MHLPQRDRPRLPRRRSNVCQSLLRMHGLHRAERLGTIYPASQGNLTLHGSNIRHELLRSGRSHPPRGPRGHRLQGNIVRSKTVPDRMRTLRKILRTRSRPPHRQDGSRSHLGPVQMGRLRRRNRRTKRRTKNSPRLKMRKGYLLPRRVRRSLKTRQQIRTDGTKYPIGHLIRLLFNAVTGRRLSRDTRFQRFPLLRD